MENVLMFYQIETRDDNILKIGLEICWFEIFLEVSLYYR